MKINGLKNYRQAKKIPQSVVAESLNISRYQYIKMEKSEIVPDKYVSQLSNILEYDFSLMTPFSSVYLQALRNIAGASQQDVAAAFGITQQSIMNQESSDKCFSYQKHKNNFFAFYKEHLAQSDVLPFVVKQVPGATLLFSFDKCYILIDDEQLFNINFNLIDPDVDITIYKLNPTV